MENLEIVGRIERTRKIYKTIKVKEFSAEGEKR